MRQSKPWLLASILSLSLVGGCSSLITGLIPHLQQVYPTQSAAGIEWLVTVANLAALVTLLANPWLTRRFGSRWVVCGGLFSPHALGLIARVYHGELRARLLGYQTGISALGNALLMALAGLVVTLGWRSVFGLYLLLLPLAGLAAQVLPGPTRPEPSQPAAAKRATLPFSKWGLCLLALVTYVLIWGVQLKLPVLLARHQIDAAVANWTLAGMNLGGLLAGLTFGRLHARLGPYVLALGYLGAALSVWAMLAWQRPAGVITAAIFFNWIYSYTGPYLVYRTNLGLAPDQIDLAASSLTIATVVSSFLAPPLWNSLSHLGPGAMTINALSWMAGALAVIALGTLLTIINTQRSKS
ncbi:MAG: MFS transporter [Lactobacillus sp.]|jgi:predicted MFS family arabinose efflux permease|uniref:MFS transporter n=1 Tax=Lacticaseibacillus suilingensis TaxID=2799577 RepID=A0ABW4BCR6_9LACO|nr:MFS transporter [Lacticaseibacillus suilingensis]MCI1893825.1 MFS transporter [Lactobacillus sp.]MCI1918173.1 MFS transporter [Lactobacillus sp.]MCI1941668.1 MFS transporter [Lactobacillus sp.]MCI1972214.1 MFS transporter [Lactobacillus sp.]MCI2017357.1 MFS transporter [Lactobacillus sp.]